MKMKMPRLALSLLLVMLLVGTPSITLGDTHKGVDEPKDEGMQQQESHVLVLETSNFADIIKEHPFIVVEFYAPWCGHCKQLQPQYEKAATILKSHDPPIVLAKVDATLESNKPLGEKYQISGFPTIKIFEDQGSIVREYKGPRDVDGIVSYLKKQVGPPSEEITSLKQGQELVEKNDILVVGVFSSYDSEEFRNFARLASEFRSDYNFKHTLDPSFLPEKDTNVVAPVIRVFKTFDEGYNDFTNFDVEATKVFLDEVSIPYVVPLNKESMEKGYLLKVFSKIQDSQVLLFCDSNAEDKTSSPIEIKKVYNELAKKYKGKGLRFVIVDSEPGLEAIQHFGGTKENLPTLIVQGNDGNKYKLEKADSNKIKEWLESYTQGNVSPFYKSQPVPERNDEPVKVVVLETFESMVLNSGKNVLVEFYAPWCGHCKKLAPILDEVAISFESDPEVIITKFDATENDIKHKEFDVKGFPTLYFYSASGKLILYEGDRSKEDLINFINANKDSTHSSSETINKEERVDSSSLKDEL